MGSRRRVEKEGGKEGRKEGKDGRLPVVTVCAYDAMRMRVDDHSIKRRQVDRRQ